MDWDDLRTFLAIARHGTLSAAARALGVTQPTMGRRLAAMEARNGARLLLRLPGRYALTPLGESVLGNAERIEAEVLAAERTITGRDVALAGTVRLTTVDTLAARIVAPALARLQVTHPGIVVELVPDTRTLSLSKREADIALRMSRFEGHEIFARRVGSLAIGFYAAPEWVERATDGQVRLVTVLDDQAHLPEAKWLREQWPDAVVGFRSNSREVQLWAAKCGAGIAALARYRADKEAGLVRLRTDVPDLARDIWLGVHADTRHVPRVRAVMASVGEMLRTHAAVLAPEQGGNLAAATQTPL
jgi:DNA-binding transcriptional LysR family regulator